MALLASTAGFAAGHLSGGGTAPRAPVAARPDPGLVERAAYVRDVDRVMRQLSAERATARHKLRRARRAGVQAAQATRLAGAYGHARAALAKAEGSGFASRPLSADLSGAERAYRRLAAAARRHDARAFKAAGAQVVVRERTLENALERLQQA
jgi:hypothetical protein